MFLRHKTLIIAFLVALLTVLVYLPALQNGFVNWDDSEYVYENPYIQSIDFKFFKWMLTTFRASHWHPLTWLSHALDYAIWGLNPLGHHLTNIILHALNTFLVVILIIRLVNYDRDKAPITVENKKFSNDTPLIAGAITGLLFGLHPLHVESVAWITERKDVLYAFFFLLSIFFYLRYTSSQKQELLSYSSLVTRHRWYSLCLLFFILSLMSKPMAVTLPVVLILLDIYPLERLNLKSAFTSQRKVLIEKIPFIVLSLVSSVITVMAALQKAVEPLEVHPLGERLLVALRTPIFYLFKMFFPINLAPLYPYPSKISFLTLEYMGSFILVVCITTLCIWSWKRHKVFSVVWVYYVVTLLPVLGIIQVGSQMAADRFTYLPSLGIFLLVGLGFSVLWKKADIKIQSITLKNLYILIPLLLVSILLATITINQIKIWKDTLTLWNAELKIFPDFYIAYKNRGVAYIDLGNYQKAIVDYDKAIKLNPLCTKAYIDRGISYTELGNYQKAIENFNKAAMINPKDIEAYYNRGIYYKILGEYQKAIKDFDNVISMDSQYIKAYVNRGDSYAKLDIYQKAIYDFNIVIELLPHDAETYNKRGIAYKSLHDYNQAIQDFSNAIKYKPEYIEAYNNRGSIYAIVGKYRDAIQDFDMAIKLNPKAVDVYVNIGMLYLKLGNEIQAVRYFQTAARLGDKQAQDYLKSKGISW